MLGEVSRGIADTNILILRAGIDPAELPDELAISAVTLAELTAGVHHVSGEGAEQERARRLDVLQRAENQFEPIPFDSEMARRYGQLCAAVFAHGRTPRRRIADLMIGATASVLGLPLYTTNPDDYAGLDQWVDVRVVTRPHKRRIYE